MAHRLNMLAVAKANFYLSVTSGKASREKFYNQVVGTSSHELMGSSGTMKV